MTDVFTPETNGLTVTIKYGKGYDDSWVVFRGDRESVRQDIIAYFGMDDASVATLTLSELVVNATQVAHGKGALASQLGATVINSTVATQGKPVEEAKPEPVKNEANPVLALIEAATDVDALKRLWATNKAAFNDPAAMAAWKAKGQALTKAA